MVEAAKEVSEIEEHIHNELDFFIYDIARDPNLRLFYDSPKGRFDVTKDKIPGSMAFTDVEELLLFATTVREPEAFVLRSGEKDQIAVKIQDKVKRRLMLREAWAERITESGKSLLAAFCKGLTV